MNDNDYLFYWRIAELTWNEFYSDRRPFRQIDPAAQREWTEMISVAIKHFKQVDPSHERSKN